MNEIYVKNQQLIKQRWPEIWSSLECSRDIEIPVEVIEGHVPTLRVGGIDLGSRYDPVSEAITQTEVISAGEPEVWLYGIGMGYVPRLLLEREVLQSLHVVILNSAIFHYCLQYLDHGDWLDDERVKLHLGVDEKDYNQPFCVIPPMLELVEDKAARLRDLIVLELNASFIRERHDAKSDILSKKIESIKEYYQADADVSDLKKINDQEVLLVAAGPSLDQQLQLIKDRADRGCVIAVDAAMRPLLSSGIIPDYVVTIDDADHNIEKYFQGDLSGLSESVLVYFPVVSRKVLDIWPGKRVMAYGSGRIYDGLARSHPGAKLYSAGSVFHVAVDLAVKLGAFRMLLFGADFSFPRDKYYASGVSREVSPADYGQGDAWVFNSKGEKVLSQKNLVGYLRDLEKYISLHGHVEFINAGYDGAMIEGASYLAD